MKISYFALGFILLLLTASNVSAHSGRTDSSGGHNCNVGACAGTYHYHNGGSAPPPYSGPKIIATPKPNPTPIIIPSTIQASQNFVYQNGAYKVFFDWDSIPNSTGYSISLSKYAGADPGPNTDTYESNWTFNHVPSGKWYVNLKTGVNNYWSQVSYWTITVPPLPTPTSSPTPTSLPTSRPSLEVKGVSTAEGITLVPLPSTDPADEATDGNLALGLGILTAITGAGYWGYKRFSRK